MTIYQKQHTEHVSLCERGRDGVRWREEDGVFEKKRPKNTQFGNYIAVSIEIVGCGFLAFDTLTLLGRGFKGQRFCKLPTGIVCMPHSICHD